MKQQCSDSNPARVTLGRFGNRFAPEPSQWTRAMFAPGRDARPMSGRDDSALSLDRGLHRRCAVPQLEPRSRRRCRAQAGLLFGDAMLRAESGELRVCPDSWLQPEGGPSRLRARLRALAESLSSTFSYRTGPLVLGEGLASLQAAIR